MATADDMEAWATTSGFGIKDEDWCESQGLGVRCDDIEIRDEGEGESWSRAFDEEFPANTPVQEGGVVVLPAGSHSHSLKSVPAPQQGSTRDRREQPAEGVRLPSTALFTRGIDPEVKQTACDWLRVQGIFMDAGDL